MTALYYLIVVPPLVVLCGLFWGCVGALLWLVCDDWIEHRKRKKLRAHRVRA